MRTVRIYQTHIQEFFVISPLISFISKNSSSFTFLDILSCTRKITGLPVLFSINFTKSYLIFSTFNAMHVYSFLGLLSCSSADSQAFMIEQLLLELYPSFQAFAFYILHKKKKNFWKTFLLIDHYHDIKKNWVSSAILRLASTV